MGYVIMPVQFCFLTLANKKVELERRHDLLNLKGKKSPVVSAFNLQSTNDTLMSGVTIPRVCLYKRVNIKTEHLHALI